jgi:hypothetical protein
MKRPENRNMPEGPGRPPAALMADSSNSPANEHPSSRQRLIIAGAGQGLSNGGLRRASFPGRKDEFGMTARTQELRQ